MGASASIGSTQGGVALNVRTFQANEVPKCGVRLSFLNQFVTSCGGRAALQGMTTTKVSSEFVVKATERYKCSLCNLLEAMHHEDFGAKAEVFISHAWKYEFLDVVDTLLDHFKNRPDIVIWFDLFSNNQHQAVELEYNWWATTFLNSIKDFRYTVMILIPWNDPIPLKRAWCLFELYCTYQTKCRFEVALGEKGRAEFIQALDRGDAANAFNRMLASIDVGQSDAYKAADRDKILDTVRSTVGISQLNGVVLALMRDWVIRISMKELEIRIRDVGDSHPRTLASMSNLALLYHGQGMYDQAESWYTECLNKQMTTLGGTDPQTLTSMNLATIYHSLGKYAQAEPLYVDCLREWRSVPGETHQHTIPIMNNLAALYEGQGKYDQAEPLYVDCLKKRSNIDANHIDTLTSLSNLGALYEKQGKFNQARSLYLECYTKRKQTLGDTHPHTLTSMNNLATMHHSLEEYAEAEPLYVECLRKERATLGVAHPHTLSTMNNLAALYECQRKYDQAEPLYVECLEKLKSALGDAHSNVLSTMNNLAAVYEGQQRYEQAESLYVDCLKKQKVALGVSHPHTVASMHNLAMLYFQQGKFDRAEPHFLECYERRKETLGASHPQTVSAMKNLAAVNRRLGR